MDTESDPQCLSRKCLGDAQESAKEAFYREGLKLPCPYLAKLFRWAAFGDWWDPYALVRVPTLVIGGRVSKVPVKIAQGIHEAVPGSSFVVFEADEGGGHAMFWEGPQKYNDSLRTFLGASQVLKRFGETRDHKITTRRAATITSYPGQIGVSGSSITADLGNRSLARW